MEIKGIKYIGPFLDGSGYSQAARDYIVALHKAGINLTLKPMIFEEAKPDLGENGDLIRSLINRDIDYNVVIIHSTPEFWQANIEKNKINIGYTIWETTKPHPDWIGYINNSVDKVIVTTEWNKEVFINSGITIPIGVVPHCIDVDRDTNVNDFKIEGVADTDFLFYNISQFVERKHMTALIKAYWNAFCGNDNVALVLKTYRSNYSEPEKNAIRITLTRLKQVCPAEHHPKIIYISDMLSDDEIIALHKKCHCYIALDRGEGWGLSSFTAGFMGKPVIATGFGGVNAYLDDYNSYKVNYSLTPVFGMPYSPWYSLNQMWAEPDLGHAIELMKEVYNNYDAAKIKGSLLKESITENFNYDIIADTYINEIKIFNNGGNLLDGI